METIEVRSACPICGKMTILTLDRERYKMFLNRKLFVQDAFPELSASERESLLSGICPTCWDMLFKEEEEDE